MKYPFPIEAAAGGDGGFTFVEAIVGMMVVSMAVIGVWSLVAGGEMVVERGLTGYKDTVALLNLLSVLEEELQAVDYRWWEPQPEWMHRESGFSLQWYEGGRQLELEVYQDGETVWINSSRLGKRGYLVAGEHLEIRPLHLPEDGIEGALLEINDHSIRLATGSFPPLSGDWSGR